MISGSCEASCEPADVGDEHPGDGAFDGALPVLCEAPASSEPCECPLDDPSSWQDLEALGGIGALDDLDRPVADPGERRGELVAGVGAVGEQMAQPRIEAADRRDDRDCPVAVLNVGRVHVESDEMTFRVG